jgi:hypothetical protein
MVELTLTSGDVQNYYVRAKTSFDALVKANENKFRGEIPRLRKSKLIFVD